MSPLKCFRIRLWSEETNTLSLFKFSTMKKYTDFNFFQNLTFF